jgi:hypothetical protein
MLEDSSMAFGFYLPRHVLVVTLGKLIRFLKNSVLAARMLLLAPFALAVQVSFTMNIPNYAVFLKQEF